ARATGWWRRTAGSSPSATPASSAPPAGAASTVRWSAWPAPPPATATGSSPPTAGPSPSATPPSTAGGGRPSPRSRAWRHRRAGPIVPLAPRPVVEPPEVSIFFYPWYATPATAPRTAYRHWEQNGHTPPDDIGSNFYPAGGLYSSLDPNVLARQARQMAASGVDTVVSSWWGQGAYEDWMLPDLVTAVKAAGLRLAIHPEPYPGRSPATVASDLNYLRGYGITDVYLYQADTPGSAADWAPVVAAHPDMRFFAESGNLGAMLSGSFADYARTAGLDGIYTYDAVRYGAAEMAATCGAARQRRLLCAPSV